MAPVANLTPTPHGSAHRIFRKRRPHALHQIAQSVSTVADIRALTRVGPEHNWDLTRVVRAKVYAWDGLELRERRVVVVSPRRDAGGRTVVRDDGGGTLEAELGVDRGDLRGLRGDAALADRVRRDDGLDLGVAEEVVEGGAEEGVGVVVRECEEDAFVCVRAGHDGDAGDVAGGAGGFRECELGVVVVGGAEGEGGVFYNRFEGARWRCSGAG